MKNLVKIAKLMEKQGIRIVGGNTLDFVGSGIKLTLDTPFVGEFNSAAELELALIEQEPDFRYTPIYDHAELGYLEWVIKASDKDWGRAAGVYFDCEALCATDGVVLHVAPGEYNDTFRLDLVASKVLALLSKTSHVQITHENSKVVCRGTFFTLEADVPEGRYPNWRAVAKTASNFGSVLSTATVSLKCKESIHKTKLEDKVNKSKLSSSQRRKYDDKLPVVEIEGGKFDANRVLSALRGENFCFYINEGLAEFEFPDGCRAYLMPLTKV